MHRGKRLGFEREAKKKERGREINMFGEDRKDIKKGRRESLKFEKVANQQGVIV